MRNQAMDTTQCSEDEAQATKGAAKCREQSGNENKQDIVGPETTSANLRTSAKIGLSPGLQGVSIITKRQEDEPKVAKSQQE
jgi:hypothetical protein